MQTSQVSVGTTAVELIGATSSSVVVKHTTSGSTVYLGGADVTASGPTGGWPLGSDAPLEFEERRRGPLYAVTASGTVTVYVMAVS